MKPLLKGLGVSPGQNLRKKYIFQWGEQHSMFSAEYWSDYWGAYWYEKARSSDFIVISENNYLDTYASSAMLDEMHRLSKLFLTKKGRKAALLSSKRSQKKYWNLFNVYKKTDLTKLSYRQLFNLLINYRKNITEIAKHFTFSDDKGLYAVTKEVIKIFRKKKISHLLTVLTTPTVIDLIFKEQVDLNKISQRKKITKYLLKKHAVKHAWLFFNSYNVSENVKFLRQRLKDGVDQNKKRNELKNFKNRQEVIFKSLKNPHIEELCYFMQAMGIDRLYLKNCWAGAEFRFLDLFNEISRRIRVPLNDMITSYTYGDYKNALLNKKLVSRKIVLQRKKFFIFWRGKSKLNLIEDKKHIDKIIKVLRVRLKKEKNNIIQGVPATPGKVKGRCRLVRSADLNQMLSDLKKFKKGEILITWMTQPNMVPIVRKASAIVADEGGIMSHAAIIAREFNIPSIVGAKIATKVLKNGEMVEVDANKGIIKKI